MSDKAGNKASQAKPNKVNASSESKESKEVVNSVSSKVVTKAAAKLQQKKAESESKLSSGKGEIDNLFGELSNNKKKRAQEDAAAAEAAETEKSRKRSKAHTMMKSMDAAQDASYGLVRSELGPHIISPDAPVHRFDRSSGLPVYKAHLLKVGEGGGTPLCPFDCDCCF
jgi:hypothetical protein